jgi:hypothetical protein
MSDMYSYFGDADVGYVLVFGDAGKQPKTMLPHKEVFAYLKE